MPPDVQQQQQLLLHPFNGLFQDSLGKPLPEWYNQSGFKMRKETMWFGNGSSFSWTIIKTICTLLQTDKHTNTSSLNFYRLDALPDAKPTVSKH